jgi:two-component system, NtrC family, C4-dicarboxylate transport sensor histidine kinase DctB
MAHQARLAAMGEMLRNIAHQWRQPLNNISLIIQNLQIEFEDGVLTQHLCHEYVQDCLKFLTYMSRTIDNFSAFYQPDGGQQQLDMYDTVTEAVSLVKEDLESCGITVRLTNKCDSTVTGYKKEFSQALLNIIQNAKEAIVLRCPTAPFIEIVCSRKGESAQVSVRDNGGGISQEFMDKIFDPYFTTKFMSQGTGVGLYMSKMIIERHMNGTISITNNAAGAEVTIELPLEQKRAADGQ